MADNGKRRVNSRSDRYEIVYEGNTVRKVQAIPQELPERKPVSRTASRNRARARKMSRGYVLFLAAVSTVTVFVCVKYLKQRSLLTDQIKGIAAQESELSQLKADNDALYNSVLASVDLEYIRKVAMNELDMNYPSEDQIIEFDTAGNSYVRQYQNIPGTE